jgi:hypothetical protein
MRSSAGWPKRITTPLDALAGGINDHRSWICSRISEDRIHQLSDAISIDDEESRYTHAPHDLPNCIPDMTVATA